MSHPLVEELREVGRKARQQALLETLTTVHQEEGEAGLRTVVREVAALGTRWKGLLAHIGNLDDTPPHLQALLRATTDDRPFATVSLRGRDFGMLQNEVEALQDRLALFHYAPKHNRLRLELKGRQFQPFGLAVVLAWVAAHAPDAVWHFPGEREGDRHLQGLELGRLIAHPTERPFLWSPETNLGILPIPPSDALQAADRRAMAESVLAAITSGETPLKADPESRGSLVRLLTELLDNIAHHAATTSHSFMVVSRRAGDEPAIRIAVCDLGAGLRKTIVESGDPSAEGLADAPGPEVLKAVMDPHVSSRAEGTDLAGFGLYFVKRATTVTYGDMLVRSGSAAYRLQHRMTASGRHRIEDFHYERDTDFPGTFVGMQLTLERPLQVDRAIAAWEKSLQQRAEKAATDAHAEVAAAGATASPPAAEVGAESAATIADPETGVEPAVDNEAAAAHAEPAAPTAPEPAASPEATPTPAPAQPPAEVEELPAHREDETVDATKDQE